MILEWSPEALDRVEEIADWMANNDADKANQWIDALFARIEKLSSSPRSGRMVPGENRDDLREVIWQGYRIVYRLDDSKVEVVTVFHSRQNFDLDGI